MVSVLGMRGDGGFGFVGFHHDGVKEYKEEFPTVQPFHTLLVWGRAKEPVILSSWLGGGCEI